MDLDFKDYPSEQDTSTALKSFVTKTHMMPSVIVHTGGGYHVYWTFSRALTLDEWHPLASSLVEATTQLGLKCDTQVTTDSARVLRIPDTTNFKRGKRVELKVLTDTDYDIADIQKALLPFPVTTHAGGRLTSRPHTNGADTNPLFPLLPPATNDDLSAGIDSIPKAKLQQVADVCPFIKHTVDTHGRDNLNPLWFHTLGLATFLEEGVEAAHIMSKGYATYSPERTEKEYSRVLREHAEKDLGWPRCNTFKGNGSKQCEACIHLSKDKTPLHFVLRAPPPMPSAGANIVSVLPPNYSRNSHGYIIKSTKNKEGEPVIVVVCNTPIGNGWVQRNPWILNFEAETEPGKIEQIHLPFEVVGATNDLRRELSRQGITIYDYNNKPIGEFLVAWIQTLKQTKDAVVNTSAFGWNVNNGKMEGFSFGGKLFTPTDIKVAQTPDTVTARSYTPVGDVQPWIDAAKLITNQNRPALNAILASSFAAPLVRFTNMRGLMMSCIGESGIGKSTALDTALAVWGHPVRAKNLLHDTDNSVMNKIGELRSLPIFWDDLQPDDTRKYARMVFQISYGKEKDRMNAQAKRRESGTWQTIMVSTSNYSLLDYVTRHTNTTTAGVYRLFEIQVDHSDGTGQIAKTDAARLVGKLDDNHGKIGELYSQYLGTNFLALEEEVLAYQKSLDIEVNAQNEERLWTSVIACLCVGAIVANRLGFTAIDESALRGFLLRTLKSMREELKTQAVDMTQDINVTTILSSFCNAHRARNTLFTNIVHKGKGKPATGSIQVRGDTSKLDAIFIHIGIDDKVMRISSNALGEWLNIKELSRHAFTTALKDKYGMKIIHGIIGGGTPHAVPGLTYMLEMSLLDFTDEIDVNDLFEKAQLPEKVTST